MQEKTELKEETTFNEELISELISMYPRDYAEMHARKSKWHGLKEKLPLALECLKILKDRKDTVSVELLGNLAHNLGVFHTHVVENYPLALELLSLAVKTKTTTKSTCPESIALSHAHLADCAYRNGDYVLAINHFNLANEAYKHKKGIKACDLERAFVLHASGNAHYNIGAYAKALDAFAEARKIRSEYLDKDDIEFAYLEHDHADVLIALGYYEEAEQLFKSSLEKKKRYFKTEDHTNIALLYQCRALLYIKSSQFDKSRDNLQQAYGIYAKHTEHFATEQQPDLFRHYFYSIILQLAAGNLTEAESEITDFKSQLQSIEDKKNPVFIRLAQVTIRLAQYQKKPEVTIKQLEETIGHFIPGLKFETADQVLSPDNKFDVAGLLSQYGIELFVHHNYQNFDECLSILRKARELKESFYCALPQDTLPLGTVNYAFSDYDFGVLYYLSALSCDDKVLRQEKLLTSYFYFEETRKKFLQVGMDKNHPNIAACTSQVNKVKELSSQFEEGAEKKTTIPKRISFFPASFGKNQSVEEDCILSLDTIIKDYP
ncbi:tetratricopeptide repeat protein [Legionella hackeliae]|uniref:Uncharacterized protein n=1 Tax=Legionella hackeliae TaxID=449 RepID=A0A0A8UR58_LEGHA|nr:tetratricopeptide repeat protein [Legionella hackeliae]KTD15277.1 Tetratricopeptide repeat protein [Legionella hackeliae]CEK11355.1 protein of unknown function [Tetratricopeptide region] [Legionella hackeliae]STX48127.1 Predicted ATPase [Legionella hackeliae]